MSSVNNNNNNSVSNNLNSPFQGGACIADELQLNIFEYLNPQDLGNISLACKELNAICQDEPLWKVVAKRIGAPVKQGANKESIKNYVLELKKTIKSYDPTEVPADISKIGESTEFPTCEEIIKLKKYIEARDVLVIWQELAQEIGQTISFDTKVFESSENVISKASEFDAWCQNNKPSLDQVSSLDLGHKNLSSIEKLPNLPKLYSLKLQNNQLQSITLTNLPELSNLDLENNQLQSITLTNLPKLYSLKLQNNQLQSLTLPNLPKLEYLDLNYNQLQSLTLTNLPELNSLYLINNPLQSLTLTNLPKLYDLYLINNPLQSLTLTNLPKLSYLHLSNNQLQSFVLKNCPNVDLVSIPLRFRARIFLDRNKVNILKFATISTIVTLSSAYLYYQNYCTGQVSELKEKQGYFFNPLAPEPDPGAFCNGANAVVNFVKGYFQ